MATAPSKAFSADPRFAALQKGLPLCARPFEELARDCRCSESELLDFLAQCRAAGLVRRFGAVFDARRLGYSSALCCAVVPRADADAAAAKITSLACITHCYLREPDPDAAATPADAPSVPTLWFTLSCPSDVFAAMKDEVSARLAPATVRFLPAVRRYKVDVVFGTESRAREESVADDTAPVTAQDRKIIGALQGDTDAVPGYFATLAEKVGMKEWELLARLEIWRRCGRLRRIGMLPRHREAGWTHNGMCCWRVEGDVVEAGRALAASPDVTHCYERDPVAEFPFNLYAMVHSRSREDVLRKFGELSSRLGDFAGSALMVSTKEYKKTSLSFFA